MIGSLRGTLLEKRPPLLLIDVHGVGYEVHAPMTSFYQLPPIGSEVLLHTHFVVRDDAQLLFGFVDKQTRELFRELIRVNGLGPKMALAILSALDTDELILCVQQNNLNTLVRVPGIGRKTAERLLVELRDRVDHWTGKNNLSETQIARAGSASPSPSIRQDAESALLALGYKPQEAEKAIQNVLKEHDAGSSEELIRLALKRMLSR
jgi:Holliday junction DNA helicase RuvA